MTSHTGQNPPDKSNQQAAETSPGTRDDDSKQTLLAFIKRALPGLLIVTLIGAASWGLANYLPRLGGVTIAIVLGIMVGNLIPDMTSYNAGVRVAEKHLLPLAIALLGVELQLMTLISLGPIAALIIGASMGTSLLVSMQVGKWFNLSKKLSVLIGAGNGVCGSSAVAATSVAIDADEEDIGISISVVNLLGTVGIFLLPSLAGLLAYSNTDSGLLIGSTLQAVGQVVAAGFSINDDVGSLATVVKMGRVLMLGPVVILIQSILSRQTSSDATESNTPAFRIPLFIIGFFILSVAASFQILPADVIPPIETIGKFVLIIAMAGIGMKIQLDSLYQSGLRTLMAGVIVSVSQIIVVMLLIGILA